jgi:hypothetical protein
MGVGRIQYYAALSNHDSIIRTLRNGIARVLLIFMLMTIVRMGFISQPASATVLLSYVNSMTRIPRTGAISVAAAVSITAAKNEYESFQIAITSPDGIYQVTNADISDLLGAKGSIINSTAATFFRVEYVLIETLSVNPEPGYMTGYYADPLIPFVNPVTGAFITQSGGTAKWALPIDISPTINGAIWVDIKVPSNAVADMYSGNVIVSFSDNTTVSIPVNLQVWDFTLPDGPSLHNTFGPLGVHSNIHTLYGVAEWSKATYSLEWRYFDELAKYRINNVPPPRFFPTADSTTGHLTITSAQTDSLRNFINRYHLTDLFIQRQYHNGIDSMLVRYPEALRTWAAEYKTYLQANGWWDIAKLYMCFEPNDSTKYAFVASRGDSIHAGASDFRVFVTEQTTPDNRAWPNLDTAVDIWCGHIYHLNSIDASLKIAEGDEVWSYQNEAHIINKHKGAYWQTDRPLTNYRVVSWISYLYGYTGFLENDIFYSDLASTWKPFGKKCNGEECLFCAGTDSICGFDGPIPTIRLKNYRDGAEDYEYMKILEGRQGRAAALSSVSSVCTSWYTFSKNPSDFTQMRLNMANQITIHTITASADSSGTITPSGNVSVNEGGSQTFTITPAAGYRVSDVLVDNVSVGAVTTYGFANVSASHSINAHFTVIPIYGAWHGNDYDGSGPYNFRMPVHAGTFTVDGNKIRINVEASATEDLTIIGAYIGEKAASGDMYDMQAYTTKQITFNQGATSASIASGETLYSDWIPLNYDKSREYIISLGTSGGYRAWSTSGYGSYYKKNALNNANILNANYYVTSADVYVLERLEIGTASGKIAMSHQGESLPESNKPTLECYPNPFNGNITIGFTLPSGSSIQLNIYNIAGQKVCDLMSGNLSAGNHAIVWNGIDAWGRHVSSGIYFARLQSGTLLSSIKMLYIK